MIIHLQRTLIRKLLKRKPGTFPLQSFSVFRGTRHFACTPKENNVAKTAHPNAAGASPGSDVMAEGNASGQSLTAKHFSTLKYKVPIRPLILASFANVTGQRACVIIQFTQFLKCTLK